MKHSALVMEYTEIYVTLKLSSECFSHAGAVLSAEYIQQQPQPPFLKKQYWKMRGSEITRRIAKDIEEVFGQRETKVTGILLSQGLEGGTSFKTLFLHNVSYTITE